MKKNTHIIRFSTDETLYLTCTLLDEKDMYRLHLKVHFRFVAIVSWMAISLNAFQTSVALETFITDI